MGDEIYQVGQWFARHHLGDVASVVGVAISLIGFLVTIYNVVRAKRAANEAVRALASVRSIIDLSAAVALIDEIKTLNRSKNWNTLTDRYGRLRNILIDVNNSGIYLTGPQKDIMQNSIFQISSIEHSLDIYLEKKGNEPSFSRFNKILSEQTLKLREVLLDLQRRESH